MEDLVRIFTFGGLRIERDGKPLPPFAARKEEALLVHLAVTQRSHPREVLADLLWDERTQAQALGNLRVVLSGLRQHLAPYLDITRQMVGLNPENSIWMDAVELDTELAQIAQQWAAPSLDIAERLDRALSLYKGEFLSGFYTRDSQGFENWMIQERERLHRQVIEALHHLVEIYINCDMNSLGITQATRLLQLDPLREDAHRQMMLLLAKTGQRNAALNQFETCRRLLDDELGVEPGEETINLHRKIQNGKIAPSISSFTVMPYKAAAKEFNAQNPYKGLQAFQESDAENFFGREMFVTQLLSRLLANHENGTHFLALVGPSGSGKSSIIKAGLIPALRKDESWLIVELVPSAQPFEKLAAALQLLVSTSHEKLLTQLQEDEQGLQRVIADLFKNDDRRLLMIIDQFEEIFTLVDDEATRKLFLNSLYNAVCVPESRLDILISLRADFYDRPMLYPTFGHLVGHNHLPVLSLTPNEMEQAIVLPADKAGLTFEPGLVATIISDVTSQSGLLPLLQYALTELYVHRRDRSMTLDAYREMGGVTGALGSRASELYGALDAKGQQATRQLFLRLVASLDGSEDTKRRIHRAELASVTDSTQVMDTVINLYGKYRLLTFDFDPVTNSPTVEIAHEALIREWKQLGDWLDEARSLLKLHRRLIIATREWTSSGRDESFLATGDRLRQFERLQRNALVLLTTDERAFVEASLAEHSAKEAQELERRLHEERLSQRSKDFLRMMYAVITLATVVTILMMAFTLSQQQRAQYYESAALESAITATNIEGQALANFKKSESARLVREGDFILNRSDQAVEQAALLYIRALKINYLPEAETSLLRALSMTSTLQIYKGHTSWVAGVAFLPDGKTIVTAGRDNILRWWDTDTGKELRQFIGHTSDVNSVAVSPDGNYILSGSSDMTVRLWDIKSGQEVHRFAGHTDVVNSVAISPDGKYALTGSADMTARLWDMKTGQEVRRFIGHTKNVKAVTFSADGKMIVTGSHDQTVRLWDVASGEQLKVFNGHSNTVFAVAISADDKTILSGSRDGTARLWDIASRTTLRVFTGHSNWVTSVAFAPDGNILTASRDGISRLWNSETGREIHRYVGHTEGVQEIALSPDGKYLLTGSMDRTARLYRLETNVNQDILVGHSSQVTSIAFSWDSRTVVTGSNDHTARLWNLRTRQQLQVFAGHTDNILGLSISMDGQTVYTGSRDKTIRIWDTKTGGLLRSFPTTTGWTSAVEFSPDHEYVVTADGTGNSAQLWDLKSGRRVREFIGHDRPIFAVAFSADGKYLLTGSSDNTARLWDVQTGTMLRIFIGHTNFVVSVAFSPDGKSVLTGSDDHTAILWETSTGRKLYTLPQQDFGPYRVAFSPDGNFIATVSGRNMLRPSDLHRTIQLWNPKTGEKLRVIANPDIEIYSLAFSPDGKKLLTGQGFRDVVLWTANYQDLIASACSRVFVDLGSDERARFGITDEQPTCSAVAAR